MSGFKSLKQKNGKSNSYSSYPYKVPVNYKALQHTKIKELQVRMMKWVSWVDDNKILNSFSLNSKIDDIEINRKKWQDRFTFTLKCQKKAGKLNKTDIMLLNNYWRNYNEKKLTNNA